MLTIFANIRVNSEDRFERLKHSFQSFQTISDQWLINIRGSWREPTLAYLREQLGGRMVEFTLLDETRGWANNSLDMLSKVKYDYLLVWNEDHMNLAPTDLYPRILKEMVATKTDYLCYSWWFFGALRMGFETAPLTVGQYVDTVEVTAETWREVGAAGQQGYVISLLGIFQKNLFERLLHMDNKLLPHILSRAVYKILYSPNYLGIKVDSYTCLRYVNRFLFANRLPIFPMGTPFNIEKENYRLDMLPLRMALPKQELFACIERDNGVEGYQLIKRGLYPPKINL